MKSLLLFLFFFAQVSWSRDMTPAFNKLYEMNGPILSLEEIISLQDKEIILVNGIMSEFFLREFSSDISWVTSEYFEVQLHHFRSLGLSTSRIAPSSFSVERAYQDVGAIFPPLREKKRQGILMVHSLGGLLLLDHLLDHPEDQMLVAGIIFLQSPFHGSPVAEILKKAPLDTVEYLKVSNREKIMSERIFDILALMNRIPILTVGTVANGSRSLFKPAIHLMKYGCLSRVLGRCIHPKIYRGPYDDSDGMVPLKSSRLYEADHVTLKSVDHGETVMNLPFQSIVKSKMGEVLLKILNDKR